MFLMFHKQNKPSHRLILLDLHCKLKRSCQETFIIEDSLLLAGTYLTGVNEAMIKNFLILKVIEETAAKAIAVKQTPLDSLVKAVLDNRIVLDHLLAKQRGICAMANTICFTWINTSVLIIETRLYKEAAWLKKMTSSARTFFDLLGFDGFGS